MSETGQQRRVFASSSVVEARFYEAFAQLDVDLMSAVWCDSETVFCLHPGGRTLLGIQAVMEGWRELFHGARPLVLSYQVIRKQVVGDMALHLVEERLSSGDGYHRGLVMATNCYLRMKGGWCLLSHQGTAMAISTDSQQIEASAILH